MSQVIIDVREAEEYEALHIADSIHIPLSEFGRRAPGILRNLGDRNVVVMCRSGQRAALACEEARKLGLQDKVSLEVFQGGILEWQKQGKPVVGTGRAPFPIMRQVQLVAGLMALTGVLLGVFVNFNFIYVAGFVGCGLTLAGATGFCPMAFMLAKMPWNKAQVSRNDCAC